MANVIYAKAQVFYNGTAAEEITSVSLRTESGILPVETLGSGLSGFALGSGRCTIELGFNIPATGTEFNFQQDCAQAIDVLLQVSVGGVDYAAVGKIESCDISQSTGDNIAGTMTWIGPLKPME